MYIYIVYIGQSKLPVGLGVFIGLGVWGSVVFCRGACWGFLVVVCFYFVSFKGSSKKQ